MSRISIWSSISFGGFLYWWLMHGFAANQIDHFAAPVWFGGLALFVHWFTNKDGGNHE